MKNNESKASKLWEILGRILYVITYPGIWLVIKCTPPRTRIIVKSDNKILLAKDWLGSGKWSLPGGGLHRNEDPQIGAIRELKEETGIVVQKSSLHYLGTLNINGDKLGSRLICYWTEISENHIIKKQHIEILDVRWVEIDNLDNVSMQHASKQIVLTFRAQHNLLH